MHIPHILSSLLPAFPLPLPLLVLAPLFLQAKKSILPLHTSRIIYTRSLVTSHHDRRLRAALRTRMTSAPVVMLQNWTMLFETRNSRYNVTRWLRNVQMLTLLTATSLSTWKRTLSGRMLRKIALLNRWRCYSCRFSWKNCNTNRPSSLWAWSHSPGCHCYCCPPADTPYAPHSCLSPYCCCWISLIAATMNFVLVCVATSIVFFWN